VLQDSRGQAIEPGDLIVYPGRHGSHLWISHARVLLTIEGAGVKSQVRVQPDFGRPVTLTRLDNVTVVQKADGVSLADQVEALKVATEIYKRQRDTANREAMSLLVERNTLLRRSAELASANAQLMDDLHGLARDEYYEPVVTLDMNLWSVTPPRKTFWRSLREAFGF
jgi:hypothetical protein